MRSQFLGPEGEGGDLGEKFSLLANMELVVCQSFFFVVVVLCHRLSEELTHIYIK